MIFFIRFITSTCLFSLLGKANVWLNPFSNILLAIGYRFFLVFSPFIAKLFGKYAITVSLIISSIGISLFCFCHDYFFSMGALLAGLGLSISGYLIKAEAAETPSGAGYNKIAINAGSLLSGLVLLITINSKNIFFGIYAIILLFLAFISFLSTRIKKNIDLPIPTKINKRKFIGWLFIGIAVGIKLFGVLSVLPQYLLFNLSILPYWYGAILFINSGIIILLQIPIIHWIDKFKVNNNSFKLTIAFMIIGMLIIAFPHFFHAYTLIGALIWITLLSLVECFASYLDVAGSQSGFLLIKETAVGLGAGLTVYLSRYFPPNYSSILIGACGIISIIIATILLHYDYKLRTD